MSRGDTGPTGPATPHHRAGASRRRLIAIALALVVVLASVGVYAYLTQRPAALVVYTYPSFFGGNCGSGAAWADAIAPFEAAHHVTVSFVCPADLLSQLNSEQSAPGADVVVGLDEITGPEANKLGLLQPYVSPQLADVPTGLANTLDPAHGITPYEWGYLAVDYTPDFFNATGGAIAHATFSDFTNNSTWRDALLIENPTTDIVGAEFLLWQIEFYQAVLHQDWTTWWKDGAARLPTAVDWGTAFGEFAGAGGSYPMVVSYTTDAAYAAANGAPGSLNTTVAHWGGNAYGWQTVYGAAVVRGTAHASLAEAFIDYLLQGTVQNGIPTNEWEYPANSTIPVPPSFATAIDPGSIIPLDGYTTPALIAANLSTYLQQWQTLENTYG